MGNVSISLAAICHAKNNPELETWCRDIINILEWEGGKLDKHVGILRIVKNASKLFNGNMIVFSDVSGAIHVMGITAYSGASYIWGATIQVLSRRVGIYY